MKKQVGIDKLQEILENGLDKWDSGSLDQMEYAQPANISWLTVEGNTDIVATDMTYTIAYKDEVEMKKQLIAFIETVITPEAFNLIRSGELKNLSFNLGPDSGSSGDMNEELGIKPIYAEDASK